MILTFDVSPARSNIGPTGLVRVHARERIPCHAQAGRPAWQGERARGARARECAGAPRMLAGVAAWGPWSRSRRVTVRHLGGTGALATLNAFEEGCARFAHTNFTFGACCTPLSCFVLRGLDLEHL